MMRGTAMIRLRELIRRRKAESASERGIAMLTAILFMIIMAGLSTVILGVVVAQNIPTGVSQKSTTTIDSAEGGLQSALAIMRTATTVTNVNGVPTTVGDPTKLPCSIPTTSVNGSTTDPTTYAVTIAYYNADPTGQNLTTFNTTHLITCAQVQSGTVPLFALLTSSGQTTTIPGSAATTGARALAAIYSFDISNVNIPGGIIYNDDSTSCLQAVSAAPNSLIKFVAASTCNVAANAPLQKWSYTTNWQIALASSTANGAQGLCITGPTASGGATQNAMLQACALPTDAGRWNQLWSWTGSYTWQGELQTILGPNPNSWLGPNVADGMSATGLYLQVINSGSANGTMTPSSLVGAGAASYSTHQLVNYKEFGRCADVTNEVLPNNPNNLISYPCKQDPTGGTSYITWNQKWYYCEPSDIGHTVPCTGTLPNGVAISAAAQQIYVYKGDVTTQKYCLTTPLTGSGTYFTSFQPCATSGAALNQQIWTRVNDPANVAYVNDYIITDEYGRCLQVDEGIPGYTSTIFYQDVAACNQTDIQKWNAPSTNTTSTVGGYKEVSGG
jgi:Tfp pilus assembly protein PilX